MDPRTSARRLSIFDIVVRKTKAFVRIGNDGWCLSAEPRDILRVGATCRRMGSWRALRGAGYVKGIEDKALVLGGCEDVIVAVMPEGVGRQKIPCGAALLKEVIVAVMPEGVGRGAGGTVVAKSASGDRRRDAGRRWAP